MTTARTAEERYAAIVKKLASAPGVTPPSEGPGSKNGFGASTLRVNDRIFAMLVRDRLVVKLPEPRVAALVASGDGACFEPRRGRQMKEWLSVDPESEVQWLRLAKEAMEFVAGRA